MITRFDHAVIATRDLAAGMRAFAALGFTVARGGRHPGHGTENAIIRFGLDYLELLAVANEREATAEGLNGQALLTYLSAHPGGLAGFALASDDIAADAARLRAFGVVVEGPFGMSRERPDGSSFAWQLAIPGGTPWRRPWPFLIAWETPDAERLAHERPAAQPNGIRGVSGVRMAVRDLDAAVALYQQGLGLTLIERRDRPGAAAEGAVFAMGQTHIELLAPRDAGSVAQALAVEGEGPFSVSLATADLEATRRTLGAAASPLASALDIMPAAAMGARLTVHAIP
ncbi:MAG TPA: VOC family protein [Ktedonobacterales bacterium]